jgi:hypothetical protein
LPPLAASSGPIQPFYLERTATQPGRGNTKTGINREIVARRSDGATVRMSPAAGSSGDFIRNLQFPDGTSLQVFDRVQAKVTWPKLASAEVLRLGSQSVRSDCGRGPNVLRHDQIDGEDVVVTQDTSGSLRLTEWAAPRLGCEPLLVRTEQLQADGSFRVTGETKASRLEIGEPDPHLFVVGPELVEMKPSQAGLRFFNSLDLSAEEKAILLRIVEEEGAEADKRYQK